MKRVLIITGNRTFQPLTGGHIRTAVIAQSLARLGYSVHLYCFAGRQEDYGASSSRMDAIEPNLVQETHLGLAIGITQALLRRLGRSRGWQHALMRRGWVPASLKMAIAKADVILADTPYCPPIPGPWAGKPWLMISHNLEYKLLQLGTSAERRSAAWMQAQEAAAPRVYSDILACAEEDQQFFRQHDGSGSRQIPQVGCAVMPDSYVVPTGTRERIRAELGVGDEIRLLAFSGSGFGPNLTALAAVKRFAKQHEGWLLAQGLRFLILGSMEPAAYREGALIVTSRVPQIAPYFAAADAGLNPVTTGSGANVKLFEYLAARLPVISTRFGARGTALVPGEDFIEMDALDLQPALAQFMAHDQPYWRAHAEAVWIRHQDSCDIQRVVAQALKVLPGF
ncbi:MAG: glycosyltransferase family 4 protein [Pseudomonadota bacterium]